MLRRREGGEESPRRRKAINFFLPFNPHTLRKRKAKKKEEKEEAWFGMPEVWNRRIDEVGRRK